MDQTLSEEDQIEEMKDCYSIFDFVGDMQVESDKIIDVLRSLGLNPLTADVNKILEDSKLTRTRVDFETFYGIYKQISKVPATGNYEDLVNGIATMDRDTSGTVGTAELRLVLMNIGDKMVEVDIDAIVMPHDDGANHTVYRDMIKKVMSA